MITSVSPLSSDFAQSVELLLKLHTLSGEGRDESEEADAIRDALDPFWYRLTREEADLLRGLSADLYSIGVDRPVPTSTPDEAAWKAFSHAAQHGDWPGTLEGLRETEERLPPAQVAYLRAACWAYLGQFDVAILFFREQQRLQPLEPSEEALFLNCLIQADRAEEALSRADEIAASETDPQLLFNAAEVRFVLASKHEGSDAESMHRKAIAIAERCLKYCEKQQGSQTVQWLRPRALMHIALSYDQLGEKADALQACKEALKYDPKNPDALMLFEYLTDEEYRHSQRPAFRDGMHRGLARDVRKSMLATHWAALN